MHRYLVDSNVLIYAFVPSDFSEECAEFLAAVSEGKLEVVINPVCVAEVHAYLCRFLSAKEVRKKLKQVLSIGNLSMCALTPEICFDALKRAEQLDLKINDAMHYSTALLLESEAIVSFDRDFDRGDIERVRPSDVLGKE